jgi:hypothetical protein
MTTVQRTIRAIALDVKANWPKPFYGAVPYLDAMSTLQTVKDYYGLDSARSILEYFLANAHTFRGEDARRLKAEIKGLLAR